MNLAECLKGITGAVIPDLEVDHLKNDTRKLNKGDVFLAYPGSQADGRAYISQAIAAGAAAIIYDPRDNFKPVQTENKIAMVAVPDLASKLAEIAYYFYQNDAAQNELKITGITGTNGKTSIACQLSEAYELLGHTSFYVGTLGQGKITAMELLNNTTPDALHMQALIADCKKKGVDRMVMEVSSHALCQHRVDYIPFSQAIFTNLTHDHLDYHGSMQAYAEAKAKLFERESLEWAIINADDPYASVMALAVKPGTKIIRYGQHQQAEVRILDWHMDETGIGAHISSPWGDHSLQLKTLGRFNLYNALAVLSSLLASGIPAAQVLPLMPKLQAAPGRLEVVSQHPLVIVDYAHTPDALENVLSTLKQIAKAKLWVVFGCGGDRDKQKRPLMGRIASQYADELILTSDNPRNEAPMQIIEDILAGISKRSYHIEENRRAAIALALQSAAKEDIILIAGKGHEDYQQIGQERFYFSDQEVVRSELALD